MKRCEIALFTTLWTALSASAGAQCAPDWLPGPGVPGLGGFAMTDQLKWDPDGTGPAPLLLVVAGYFHIADRELAYSVAAWDGAAWTDLGFDEEPWLVTAITVYNGELIAAASRTDVPPGFPVLFRRTGSAWVQFQSGVSQYAHPYEAGVNDMVVYQGELVVAGSFSHAGGQPARNIARWNGSSWQPLGTGVDGGVGALLVHNLTLHVGGSFASAGGQPAANVAKWNGVEWLPMGAGVGGSVSALTAYNGGIAAGGSSPAGGSYTNFVSHWNGSTWQPLGGAMAPSPVAQTRVAALSVYNGELIAGGVFRDPSGAPASGVSRWNGSVWQSVGTGVQGDVRSLGAYQGRLIAGGDFRVAGGMPASNVAAWSAISGQWARMSDAAGAFFDGPVHALTVFEGEPVAVGRTVLADGRTVSIVRWTGDDWLPLGNGEIRDASGQLYQWGPIVAAPHAGGLAVGGTFASVGGVQAARIARWDGAAWRALGSGMTDTVFALIDFGGDLIAGGTFLNAGGQPASRIARWDAGTQTWHALGLGVGSTTGEPAWVNALALYAGSLIAGGSFTLAGGQPANRIARWDGTGWQALGGGVGFAVGALAEHNEALFAVSRFYETASVARWDGTAWEALPSPMIHTLTAAAAYKGELVVAGYPTAVSSSGTTIARWNGADWQTLGAGLWSEHLSSGGVASLLVHNGQLVAGGEFVGAGGGISYHLAHWDCPCYADCNHNQFLGVGDFACFQTLFVLHDPYADCNADGSFTVADFGCFQGKYVLGCP